MSKVTRSHWTVTAVAIAAALLLVSLWARGLPLWVDEQMLALNVRDRPMSEFGRLSLLAQSAPPAWLVLERAALAVFGPGERALRVVPLGFGLGTLVVVVWAARRWMGPAGGITLVTLMGAAPWVVYHATEAKQYSADAFWATLLPVMAAWVIEAVDGPANGDARGRLWWWWSLAAVGPWLSTGAMLVAPACAVVLTTAMARRHGARGVAHVALRGLPWLVSFGVLFTVSLRHTIDSDYMQTYWAFAMPPDSASAWGRVTWVVGRLEAVAMKPAGSRLGIGLWIASALGFALGAPRWVAACCAGVPLTAFLLAALRVVPLFERLSLWVVPALFVGVAMLADRSVQAVVAHRGRHRPWRAAVATLGVAASTIVVADVVLAGAAEVHHTVGSQTNHALDDRAAVRWLEQQKQPGDAWMTTDLAFPAILVVRRPEARRASGATDRASRWHGRSSKWTTRAMPRPAAATPPI